MRDGYIVVREEKHLEPKFWVCECLSDAQIIFVDVSTYWIGEYSGQVLDFEACGDTVLQAQTEDEGFNVYVAKQAIRAKGETGKKEHGLRE